MTYPASSIEPLKALTHRSQVTTVTSTALYRYHQTDITPRARYVLYARARTHARTALPPSLGGLRLKSVTQLRLGIMRPPYTITVTVRHAYDVTLPIPP